MTDIKDILNEIGSENTYVGNVLKGVDWKLLESQKLEMSYIIRYLNQNGKHAMAETLEGVLSLIEHLTDARLLDDLKS